eukprot:g1321.t1
MVCGKTNNPEQILLCDKCDAECHMYCLDPPLHTIPEEKWYCPNCVESGGCGRCGKSDDQVNMILCDGCPAEYHLYCLRPRLDKAPEGDWFCPKCERLREKRLKKENKNWNSKQDTKRSNVGKAEVQKKKPTKSVEDAKKSLEAGVAGEKKRPSSSSIPSGQSGKRSKKSAPVRIQKSYQQIRASEIKDDLSTFSVKPVTSSTSEYFYDDRDKYGVLSESVGENLKLEDGTISTETNAFVKWPHLKKRHISRTSSEPLHCVQELNKTKALGQRVLVYFSGDEKWASGFIRRLKTLPASAAPKKKTNATETDLSEKQPRLSEKIATAKRKKDDDLRNNYPLRSQEVVRKCVDSAKNIGDTIFYEIEYDDRQREWLDLRKIRCFAVDHGIYLAKQKGSEPWPCCTVTLLTGTERDCKKFPLFKVPLSEKLDGQMFHEKNTNLVKKTDRVYVRYFFTDNEKDSTFFASVIVKDIRGPFTTVQIDGILSKRDEQVYNRTCTIVEKAFAEVSKACTRPSIQLEAFGFTDKIFSTLMKSAFFTIQANDSDPITKAKKKARRHLVRYRNGEDKKGLCTVDILLAKKEMTLHKIAHLRSLRGSELVGRRIRIYNPHARKELKTSDAISPKDGLFSVIVKRYNPSTGRHLCIYCTSTHVSENGYNVSVESILASSSDSITEANNNLNNPIYNPFYRGASAAAVLLRRAKEKKSTRLKPEWLALTSGSYRMVPEEDQEDTGRDAIPQKRKRPNESESSTENEGVEKKRKCVDMNGMSLSVPVESESMIKPQTCSVNTNILNGSNFNCCDYCELPEDAYKTPSDFPSSSLAAASTTGRKGRKNKRKQSASHFVKCASCPRQFHISCLDPPLERAPSADWQCPSCRTCQGCGGTIITLGVPVCEYYIPPSALKWWLRKRPFDIGAPTTARPENENSQSSLEKNESVCEAQSIAPILPSPKDSNDALSRHMKDEKRKKSNSLSSSHGYTDYVWYGRSKDCLRLSGTNEGALRSGKCRIRVGLCETCFVCYTKNEFCPVCGEVWEGHKPKHLRDEEAIEREERKEEMFSNDDAIPSNDGEKNLQEIKKSSSVKSSLNMIKEEGNLTQKETAVIKSDCPDKNPMHMVCCDACGSWVHAGCDNFSEHDFLNLFSTEPGESSENGNKKIKLAKSNEEKKWIKGGLDWTKYYVCPHCRYEKLHNCYNVLRDLDPNQLFFTPIKEEIAPNYFDIVKYPIDLKTIGIQLHERFSRYCNIMPGQDGRPGGDMGGPLSGEFSYVFGSAGLGLRGARSSLARKACEVCRKADNTDKILLCDGCPSEYHMYCLEPKLTEAPEGEWFCPRCAAARQSNDVKVLQSAKRGGDSLVSMPSGDRGVGAYRFYADFVRVCVNAMVYNEAEGNVWRAAKRFYNEGKKLLREVLPILSPGPLDAEFGKLVGDVKKIGQMRKDVEVASRKRVVEKQAKTRIELLPPIPFNRPLPRFPFPALNPDQLALFSHKNLDAVLDRNFTNLKTESDQTRIIVTTPPFFELERYQGFNLAWYDCCLACGSFGDVANLRSCVDCGESWHTYCSIGWGREPANPEALDGKIMGDQWRCPNCTSICELCGESGPSCNAHDVEDADSDAEERVYSSELAELIACADEVLLPYGGGGEEDEAFLSHLCDDSFCSSSKFELEEEEACYVKTFSQYIEDEVWESHLSEDTARRRALREHFGNDERPVCPRCNIRPRKFDLRCDDCFHPYCEKCFNKQLLLRRKKSVKKNQKEAKTKIKPEGTKKEKKKAKGESHLKIKEKEMKVPQSFAERHRDMARERLVAIADEQKKGRNADLLYSSLGIAYKSVPNPFELFLEDQMKTDVPTKSRITSEAWSSNPKLVEKYKKKYEMFVKREENRVLRLEESLINREIRIMFLESQEKIAGGKKAEVLVTVDDEKDQSCKIFSLTNFNSKRKKRIIMLRSLIVKKAKEISQLRRLRKTFMNGIINCTGCGRGYHAKCLNPVPHVSLRDWYCSKCVKCTHSDCAKAIGIMRTETNSWSMSRSLCNYHDSEMRRACSVCQFSWSSSPLLGELLQCDGCNSWVHASCGRKCSIEPVTAGLGPFEFSKIGISFDTFQQKKSQIFLCKGRCGGRNGAFTRVRQMQLDSLELERAFSNAQRRRLSEREKKFSLMSNPILAVAVIAHRSLKEITGVLLNETGKTSAILKQKEETLLNNSAFLGLKASIARKKLQGLLRRIEDKEKLKKPPSTVSTFWSCQIPKGFFSKVAKDMVKFLPHVKKTESLQTGNCTKKEIPCQFQCGQMSRCATWTGEEIGLLEVVCSNCCPFSDATRDSLLDQIRENNDSMNAMISAQKALSVDDAMMVKYTHEISECKRKRTTLIRKASADLRKHVWKSVSKSQKKLLTSLHKKGWEKYNAEMEQRCLENESLVKLKDEVLLLEAKAEESLSDEERKIGFIHGFELMKRDLIEYAKNNTVYPPSYVSKMLASDGLRRAKIIWESFEDNRRRYYVNRWFDDMCNETEVAKYYQRAEIADDIFKQVASEHEFTNELMPLGYYLSENERMARDESIKTFLLTMCHEIPPKITCEFMMTNMKNENPGFTGEQCMENVLKVWKGMTPEQKFMYLQKDKIAISNATIQVDVQAFWICVRNRLVEAIEVESDETRKNLLIRARERAKRKDLVEEKKQFSKDSLGVKDILNNRKEKDPKGWIKERALAFAAILNAGDEGKDLHSTLRRFFYNSHDVLVHIPDGCVMSPFTLVQMAAAYLTQIQGDLARVSKLYGDMYQSIWKKISVNLPPQSPSAEFQRRLCQSSDAVHTELLKPNFSEGHSFEERADWFEHRAFESKPPIIPSSSSTKSNNHIDSILDKKERLHKTLKSLRLTAGQRRNGPTVQCILRNLLAKERQILIEKIKAMEAAEKAAVVALSACETLQKVILIEMESTIAKESTLEAEAIRRIKYAKKAVLAGTLEADVFCLCKAKLGGGMIGCESENCSYGEWFHYACLALPEDFNPTGKWLCPECSGAIKVRKKKRKAVKTLNESKGANENSVKTTKNATSSNSSSGNSSKISNTVREGFNVETQKNKNVGSVKAKKCENLLKSEDAVVSDKDKEGKEMMEDTTDPLEQQSASRKKMVPWQQPKAIDCCPFSIAADTRKCELCKIAGDHEICGRLLPLPMGKKDKTENWKRHMWVHTNCALWSSEVVEGKTGALQSLSHALQRSRSLRCSLCHLSGATVGCNYKNCRQNFHYHCALAAGCLLKPAKTTKIAEEVNGTVNWSFLFSLGKEVWCKNHLKSENVRPDQSYIGVDGPARTITTYTRPRRMYVDSIDEANIPDWALSRGKTAMRPVKKKQKRMKSFQKRTNISFFNVPMKQSTEIVLQTIPEYVRLGPERTPLTVADSQFTITRKNLLDVNKIEKQNFGIMRIGALSVISLGSFVDTSTGMDEGKMIPRKGFNTERYLFPPGFSSLRLHFTPVDAGEQKRTLYRCTVLDGGKRRGPIFVIEPLGQWSQDIFPDKFWPIIADSADKAVLEFNRLINGDCQKSWDHFGRSSEEFFGFGCVPVARKLECLRGVTRLALPETAATGKKVTLGRYRFSYRSAPRQEIDLAWQQHQTASLEQETFISGEANPSGCARCEGIDSLEGAAAKLKAARLATSALSAKAAKTSQIKGDHPKTSNEPSRTELGFHRTSSLQEISQYRALKAMPVHERVEARRSTIHGWGLFTKKAFKRNEMIIEYVGEVVRQGVADLREKRYEEEGMGSCYLFRIDQNWIVDATRRGGIARFINHCCVPNGYSKTVKIGNDNSVGQGRKIIIFAKEDLPAGIEVLYDYKFSREIDVELRCNCGHKNCIGRMN